MQDEEIAHQITERLVAVLHPSRVIWFGSRAAGKGDNFSDYDFVVVAPGNLSIAERAFKAQWAAREIKVPKDILVLSPEEFARYSEWKSSVVYCATKTGKTLYETGD